jgi:hypothetical protein
LKSRALSIIGLAHAVALALLALAALLLATEWPDHPSLTGVRRQALGLYFIANAAMIEVYMLGRNLWPSAPLHFTLIHAGLSANEVMLRSFAIVNIGLAVGALLIADRDRWWLMALAALGIFAFRLSLDFPESDRARDWTIGEIIRHYAQESKRYARWLSFMQHVYGTVSLLIWLLSVALLIVVVGVGANFGYAAFLSKVEPTWADLGSTMLAALAATGELMARVLPALALAALAIGALSALYQLLSQSWEEPRPRTDTLKRDR